jgi:pSer/pThr/pTyr-binding forkhead associated (FHA) protein
MFVVSVRERGKEEHRFTFRKDHVTIGRLRANDVILPKRNISKRHAQLSVGQGGQVTLQDFGSTNGCYVNGTRVEGTVPVGPEDKLFMGDYILQVLIEEDRSVLDDVPPVDHPSYGSAGAPMPETMDLGDPTLRLEAQAEFPGTEEPAEDLIDIPLEPEEPPEEPEDISVSQQALSQDLSLPLELTPAPKPVLQPVKHAPSVPHSELDAVYGTLVAKVRSWWSEQTPPERGQAVIRIASILSELVGETIPELDRKRLSVLLFDELAPAGLPGVLMKDPSVAEVVVNANGLVLALAMDGSLVGSPRRLSCQAALLALASAAEGHTSGSSASSQTIFTQGIVLHLVPAGTAGPQPALRYVRIPDPAPTVAGMTQRGIISEPLAAALVKAVSSGRSAIVFGGTHNFERCLVRALCMELSGSRRGLVIGGFPDMDTESSLGSVGSEVAESDLLQLVVSMGYRTLIAGYRSQHKLGDILRVSATMLIPHIIPLRCIDPRSLVSALQCSTGMSRAEVIALLDALKPVLVLPAQDGSGVGAVADLELTPDGAVSIRPIAGG